MKEKRKIVNGRILSSTDGGANWKDIGAASPADIAAFEKAKAAKKSQKGDSQANKTKVAGAEPDDLDRRGIYFGREDERTPGGFNPRSIYKSDEALAEAYKKMGIDYSQLSDKQAQRLLYDKADPFQVAYMWGAIGNTKRGLSSGQQALFDKWKPKDKESITAYKKRLAAAGYTPETLRKELEPYKESFADSYRGLREAALLNPMKEDETPQWKPEVKTTRERKPLEREPLGYYPQPDYAPWWLQDVIKTAHAAGNLARVNKYPPWMGTPGVTLPEPTYYDPTRELAANAELANIGTQGLASFTNPQAFAAGFSAIQAGAARNAADILGKYNTMNVGVANDFELRRKAIMNEDSANKANIANQLHRDYAILDQQFDNSKNIRRDQLVDTYTNAITNKQYTANMNDLTEQYKIDPASGGRIRWHGGRPIKPTQEGDPMASLHGAAKALIEQGIPATDAYKISNDILKTQGTGIGYDPSTLMGYPGNAT